MKLGSITPHSMPCGECPAGTLHRQQTTLLTWLGNELITVPDFPAWVCDICGRREYDQPRFGSIKPDLIPDRRQTHTQATEDSSPADREGNPNAQFTGIEPISRNRSGGVLKKLVAPATNEYCTYSGEDH